MKIIWINENTRRLKFGGAYLPLSGCRWRKPVNRKSNAERRGDATPVRAEVSISQSDLSVVILRGRGRRPSLRRKENLQGRGRLVGFLLGIFPGFDCF